MALALGRKRERTLRNKNRIPLDVLLKCANEAEKLGIPLDVLLARQQVKLPNGKAAWENEKDKQKAKAQDANVRWMHKNKVGYVDVEHESSSEDDTDVSTVGDSSQEGGGNLEKLPNGKYRQTGVVNVVLYVGLGLISIGLIVTFVGMGERGFKTNELKLIGPSLIGCGLLFSILRILFCSCPKCGDCKVQVLAHCKKPEGQLKVFCFGEKGENHQGKEEICIGSPPDLVVTEIITLKTQSLDEKALLAPSQESLAEEANEGPRPEPDGEESDGAPERHFTSKSARTVRSHHPNYIDDEVKPREKDKFFQTQIHPTPPTRVKKYYSRKEVEDDEVLGLNVDYMDETIRGRDGSAGARSRRLSEDSNDSVASKVPKLPEIHAATSKNGNELVLNPAKLGGVGD